MPTVAGQGGFAPLRRMIARHLLMSRGVRCEPSEIIIVSSMTAAISLAASILAKPGDPVAIEDPGHAGTRKAIEHLALTPVHIAVDAEGLRVEDLRLCTAAPRIVCVASGHHWPTGVSLDAARRTALMDWAEHEGAWILETDYDSEFHFGEGPPTPLKAEASGGRVLLTGSFSRTLAPAIRCAYLVMPGELAALFRERAIIAVGEPSLHVQAALAEFMRRGHFVRHVQRQRKVYKDRRDALRQTLTDALGSVMTLRPPAGGLHLVADLDPCYAAEAVSREAAQRGLTIQAMAAYYATRPPPNALHLGFAAVPSKDIPAAVSRLGEAISAAR
jgi:GntR family transcriptional regulator/MocR family aminotransferase